VEQYQKTRINHNINNMRKAMKLTMMILMGSICLSMVGATYAQNVPYPSIEVTLRKTSSIVFPVAIQSGDRGSNDILVQKAKGARNVLKVKAGKKNFLETNVTVITDDGLLHHYLIRYSDQPGKYVFYADSLERKVARPPVFLNDANLHEVEGVCQSIVTLGDNKKVGARKENQMRMVLRGIYIQDKTMYYHLQVDNKSNIPYDIDLLQFLIRDKQKVKRMASQEVREVPLFVYGNPTVVPGWAGIDLVYALPKFTIPDAKDLVIQLIENHGGRHLELHVKNRSIIRANTVPAN
jgi:conjugative transposon TraN protein